MKAFSEIFGRTFVDNNFRNELNTRSSVGSQTNPDESLRKIKVFLKAKAYKFSFVEMLEIRRIFFKANEPGPNGDSLIDLLVIINNILVNVGGFDLISNQRMFHEILALFSFDRSFSANIFISGNEDDVKSRLLDYHFEDGEVLSEISSFLWKIFKNVNQGETLDKHFNDVHDLKWIRPSNQIILVENICLPNISADSATFRNRIFDDSPEQEAKVNNIKSLV